MPFFEVASKIVSLSENKKRILEDVFAFRQVPRKFLLAQEGKIAKEL